jgi:hypothetical protein
LVLGLLTPPTALLGSTHPFAFCRPVAGGNAAGGLLGGFVSGVSPTSLDKLVVELHPTGSGALNLKPFVGEVQFGNVARATYQTDDDSTSSTRVAVLATFQATTVDNVTVSIAVGGGGRVLSAWLDLGAHDATSHPTEPRKGDVELGSWVGCGGFGEEADTADAIKTNFCYFAGLTIRADDQIRAAFAVAGSTDGGWEDTDISQVTLYVKTAEGAVVGCPVSRLRCVAYICFPSVTRDLLLPQQTCCSAFRPHGLFVCYIVSQLV